MRTGTMTYKTAGRTSGFTMVELLIAIIIIGVLVTIIVPVLSNRAADARLAAAKADMEAIANAESQVALDTGYIVLFRVLDDSGVVGDNKGSDDPTDVIDTIQDEDDNLTNNGGPKLIFLDAKTGTRMQATFYDRVALDPGKFGWNGPYANFQKKLKPTNPLTPFPAGFEWVYGAPLDPWGNPYFLFVAGESTGSGLPAVGGWIDEKSGSLNPSPTFNYGGSSVSATQFDRFTILSLGPNGVPGTGVAPNDELGTGDDLVRAF